MHAGTSASARLNAEVFALLAAPQSDLAAALRSTEWFQVGPTTNGWTPAWWADPVGPVGPDARSVVLSELRSILPEAVDAVVVAETWHAAAGDVHGALSVAFREAGETVGFSWCPPWAAPAGAHAVTARRSAALETALQARFGASPLAADGEGRPACALERVLMNHDDVPAVVQALAVWLRLPAVEPPDATSSLVLHRRSTRASATAVDVAVRTGGAACAADLGVGWIAYRPGSAVDVAQLAHLASVAATSGDVILLEGGSGVSRVEVHRAGRLVEARTADGWWRSGEVGPASEATRPGAVLELVTALGVPARAHALLEAPEAAFDETRGATTSARLLVAMLAPGRWRRPRLGFSPRAGSARR